MIIFGKTFARQRNTPFFLGEGERGFVEGETQKADVDGVNSF